MMKVQKSMNISRFLLFLLSFSMLGVMMKFNEHTGGIYTFKADDNKPIRELVNSSRLQMTGSEENKAQSQIPRCENTLQNLTRGKWVKKIDLLTDKTSEEYKGLVRLEEDIDKRLQDFRTKRGIGRKTWRDDLKCGYSRLRSTRNLSAEWKTVGSWCDPLGPNPCCSDVETGYCMSPSQESCSCERCVDMRKILHADLSEWVTEDARCKHRNYSSTEACDVITGANITALYFVGDSFVRKMYRAFILTLTGDVNHGAVTFNTSKDLESLCVGDEQFYWPSCKFSGTSLKHLKNSNSLCGGPAAAPFNAFYYKYYNIERRYLFLALVKSLLGKRGTVILLSVGVHMGCNAHDVTENFLRPTLDLLRGFYGPLAEHNTVTTWPHIVFLPPVTAGLLKPTMFIRTQGNKVCGEFARAMEEYCGQHGMTFLNFRKLTENLHSFDGTHYGIAVNLMKVQIFLNYLASFS